MAALTAEDFKTKLAAAGIDQTKPLYAVLSTVMETAATAQSAVKGGARGLTPEGERELIHRVVETVGASTEHHINRLAWRVGFWNTTKLSLLGIVFGAGSYLLGQYQADAHRTAIMEGAEFTAQLSSLNDPSALRSYCQAHSFPQDGGIACNLPAVWVRRGR